jgi:HD-GYP domain-containing protein (c-di-GMP phosphodiesterase class II)
MTTDGSENGDRPEESAELEPVEELAPAALEAPRSAAEAPHFSSWQECYLNNAIPSLFLDGRLRILRVNDSFCRMFGCNDAIAGQYFTQFFAPYFDEPKSADLFRAIRSAAEGYRWHGRVEKLGTDQLLNVSKAWIVPLGPAAEDSPPISYGAVCLDMTTEHRQLLQSTFASLLGAARLKDNDTGNHIERVNRYARILGQNLLGRPETPLVDREFVETIGQVAALHDVGKIGTPDDILNKAGRLEAWEWDVMKQHTTNGAYILSTYPNPMASEIALRHHERWDGTGYPHGWGQDLIPLSARIVAVGDVYDALRMRRNYKEPYTHEQAVENMAAESGTHFDPFLVERFLDVAGSFREVFSELADSQ